MWKSIEGKEKRFSRFCFKANSREQTEREELIEGRNIIAGEYYWGKGQYQEKWVKIWKSEIADQKDYGCYQK